MPDTVIRRPVADDIHQTLALLLRCKIPEYGLEGLRQEWNEMDLTQDAWLAFRDTDNLVGYATVTPYQAACATTSMSIQAGKVQH